MYDRQLHQQLILLQAMDEACKYITSDLCLGFIIPEDFFLAREHIHFDVDENLWPNSHDRDDGHEGDMYIVRTYFVYFINKL